MLIKKFAIAFCCIILMTPTTSVMASNDYTLTIRAGSSSVNGHFTEEYKNYINELLNKNNITSYDFSEKTIRITIPEGSALPELPTSLLYVDVPLDYYILPSGWGYAKNSGVIFRNEDIVVQYGRLINGVEYTVYYLERGTTRNIAAPYINRGKDGEKIEKTAILINGYTLDMGSLVKQEIKLDKNISENSIQFYYNYAGPGSTYSETTETSYVDGGATTEYRETEVPTYIATATAGDGMGAGEGGNAGEIAIAEEGVPLEEAPEETGESKETEKGENEKKIIEDENPPLTEKFYEKDNWLIWVACILGAAVIITGTTYIGIKRVNEKAINNSMKDDKKKN